MPQYCEQFGKVKITEVFETQNLVLGLRLELDCV